jgi:hypothetical protein
MKLVDLRRLTVKKRLRIRFPLSNGMECMLNEHGVAQVPALRAVPAFNLEDELSAVQEFVVEQVVSGSEKTKAKPQSCTRQELASMLATGVGGEGTHEDRDE